MPKQLPPQQQLLAENEELRARLEEAEETLREILSGDADALFVRGAGGVQLFTLKGADQSYRTLIENMSEGALTMTAQGVIVYANGRFAELLRIPLEKVIGSEVHTWFTPESRQFLQTVMRKDAVGSRSKELALAAADGTQVPVYLSVNRLLLDGVPDSFCMVATDLTEHKRDEALLAAEKLARAILEQAADAIVICDKAGWIIRASKQAQALYDKDLLGQPFEHAFPLRQVDGTAFSPVGAIDTNRHQSVEARLERNGKWLDLLVSVGHLMDARNELLGSVVTLTDITERKHTEVVLQRQQTELRVLFDLLPVMIWFKDTENRILRVNKQVAIAAGKSVEEIEGKPSAEIYPEYAAKYLEEDLEVIRSGTSRLSLIESMRGPDNEEIWVHTDKVPVCDKDGKILGICVMAQDITANKQSELKVSRMNRVYAVMSGINSLIVRARDRDELFSTACRIAVEEGAFKMAWIGVSDPQTLDGKVVAWYGGDEGYVDKIRLSAREDAPESELPACRALRLSRPIICNDIATELPEGSLRDESLQRGHKSVGCFPLTAAGCPDGVLALFAGEVDVFDADETRLLRELANDISNALDHLHKAEQINYLAYYDLLTGLANRSLFHDRLEQALTTAEAQGYKLGLVLVDVRRFKSINDSLGRHAGDALLKEVAKRLSTHTEDDRRLARIDADHFAVFVPEIPNEEVLARRIEQRLEQVFGPLFNIDDTELRVSAKCGIAMFPADGVDADTLLGNAEDALRNAKTSDDRYLFYTKTMNARVAGKLTLENQLRQALEKEEFVLHYQPKVNLASGKLTGAEALIRWNDPRMGLVPPNQFIPVLEETGLIQEVGQWAKRKAVDDYLRWRNAGLAAVRIAVNVSPLQLRRRDFIRDIERTIGVDPHAAAGLELEITEGVFIRDLHHSIASLTAIRALGVKIAIDDFGTGFSSLSYLAKLPVDSLKIDRSFVIDMTAGPEGLALVSTIINLAHALKINVVAEGVETEEQSRLLRLLNCDEMQGFLFSKPVPADIFEARFLVPSPV